MSPQTVASESVACGLWVCRVEFTVQYSRVRCVLALVLCLDVPIHFQILVVAAIEQLVFNQLRTVKQLGCSVQPQIAAVCLLHLVANTISFQMFGMMINREVLRGNVLAKELCPFYEMLEPSLMTKLTKLTHVNEYIKVGQ